MENGTLTLGLVADQPWRATQTLLLPDGEAVLYRPLLPTDAEKLTEFLESLSPRTRCFWELDSYDRSQAEQLCAAINRYDKFRMVALNSGTTEPSILASFEFAFWVGSELARFRSYGVELNEEETCRFGPCVRDSCQNRGLGTGLMPYTLDLARRFGMRYVVLWGGVFQDNVAAIHFYKKHRFRTAGTFQESRGRSCFDMFISLDIAGENLSDEHKENPGIETK